MGGSGENMVSKPSIASSEHQELLNVIDKIRSQGISRYIDLPQIVVCGDQSSGKSSCLEALCSLRFPTGDGLCTRFGTEYILRRSVEENITISIVPDAEASDVKKTELNNFKPSTCDLNKFDVIIKEASAAMGIGSSTTSNFAQDTLRVEISGPTQPHLTLVDLPGLFHSQNKDQSTADKEAVYAMVGSYVAKSRSIILAVATAKNDLNNQTVLDFVRKYDPEGLRTLGIITKPDTLATGSPSEASFYTLATNSDIRFALGWHVLRNRSWVERDSDSLSRDRVETEFFSSGIWQNLEVKSKGVASLRLRLSKILQDHILKELPHLMKEVDAAIVSCREKLNTLGSSRGTAEQQRLYLLGASQKFTSLISAAINGGYETDQFFGSSSTEVGYQRRLRAYCKAILTAFEEKMRTRGHAFELVDTLPNKYSPKPGVPLKMTKNSYLTKVEKQMTRNAGTELPGFWNPGIIGDLFFDQSAPWQKIISTTKHDLLQAARITISHVLGASADETTARGILREIINPHLGPIEQNLNSKIEEILFPHVRGRPVTLNHYLIDNLQRKRQEQARKDLSERVHDFLGPNNAASRENKFEGSFNIDSLIDSLVVEKTEVDMNRFAALEASNAADAYYKLALKNVLDAITMYAIEVCLLSKLPTIFTPQHVIELDMRVVTSIAGESQESMVEREALGKKLVVLEETQQILYRLDQHKIRGRLDFDERSQPLEDFEAIPQAADSHHDNVPEELEVGGILDSPKSPQPSNHSTSYGRREDANAIQHLISQPKQADPYLSSVPAMSSPPITSSPTFGSLFARSLGLPSYTTTPSHSDSDEEILTKEDSPIRRSVKSNKFGRVWGTGRRGPYAS